MLYDDEDETNNEAGNQKQDEDDDFGQGNVPFSKIFLDQEEDFIEAPQFKFIFQPNFTLKPGPLLDALKVPHLKAHFKQLPYSLLTLLVFLPFYLPIPYILNTAHNQAE